MTPSLELLSVGKSFGTSKVLDEITLDLKKGEFLTMLGPSGSGKTTTLRIVAGFYKADEGQVLMHGRSVDHVPTHKRNIGMVFQDYALFPHFNVEDNVGFPLEARGQSRRKRRGKVEEMLQVVGLGQLAKRLPRELSGGQQQRVALARALVFDPEIVLLDEPLAALDKKLRSAMQLEILRITRQFGATVISVTHDQEEALVMSDRIALFSQGRLAQIGTPRELYEHPQNEFVADFIGESNILHGRLVMSEGAAEVVGADWRAGVSPDIAARCGSDPARVTIMIRPERIELEHTDAITDVNRINTVLITVSELIYVGSGVRVIGQTAGGETLQVRPSDGAQAATIQPGQRILAHWKASDCVFLAR